MTEFYFLPQKCRPKQTFFSFSERITMSQPSVNKSLVIDDREFGRVTAICNALRETAPTTHEAERKQLIDCFNELRSRGVEPFAAVIFRSLQNEISDQSINLFSELLNLTMTDSRFRLSDFEKTLFGVMAFPFMMKMSFGIPVKEWPKLAEAGRTVVLAFLETGSETDPKYVAAKNNFDPLYESERRRFIADPILGKRIRENQYI